MVALVYRLSSAGGLTGTGLVLLRLSAAAMLVVPGPAHWIMSIFPGIGIVLWLFAIALAAGLWTAVVAAICGAGAVVLLTFPAPAESVVAVICLLLNMSALALLGAGAYSLDALLYGRRRITFNR